ncbi:hypothetical protein ACFX2J_004322 [Malus domestica]
MHTIFIAQHEHNFMEKLLPLPEGQGLIIPASVDGDEFSFYCCKEENSYVYNTKTQKPKSNHFGVDPRSVHKPV